MTQFYFILYYDYFFINEKCKNNRHNYATADGLIDFIWIVCKDFFCCCWYKLILCLVDICCAHALCWIYFCVAYFNKRKYSKKQTFWSGICVRYMKFAIEVLFEYLPKQFLVTIVEYCQTTLVISGYTTFLYCNCGWVATFLLLFYTTNTFWIFIEIIWKSWNSLRWINTRN